MKTFLEIYLTSECLKFQNGKTCFQNLTENGLKSDYKC